MGVRACARLVDDVVDLAGYRAYLDFGIEEPRRTDDLLDTPLAHTVLVIARSRRHVDELRNAFLELVEAQRAVVKAARKAEPMLGERDLPAAVTLVHASDLRNRHMALVDDAEEVVREVIDERIRRFAGAAAVEMARIVLDAGAEAHGFEHLEIVVGAHLEPLRLEELAFGAQLLKAPAQLLLDRADRLPHLGTRRDIVRCGPDGNGLEAHQRLAREIVDLLDGFDLVAPELDAQRIVGIRREDVERISAHAEGAA